MIHSKTGFLKSEGKENLFFFFKCKLCIAGSGIGIVKILTKFDQKDHFYFLNNMHNSPRKITISRPLTDVIFKIDSL